MVNLEVEIPGLTAELGKLDQFSDGLDDMTPFLKNAGMLLIASSQKNFIEGGRPDKWAPLSEVSILLRAKSKGAYRTHKRGQNKGRVTAATFRDLIQGVKILRDTDLLMASIGSPEAGGVYTLMPDSITIGSALKYAEYQNDGVESTKGYIEGKKIPARKFMVAQDEDKVRIYDMAVEFVDDRKKQAGL